jgi:hypothetical protein
MFEFDPESISDDFVRAACCSIGFGLRVFHSGGILLTGTMFALAARFLLILRDAWRAR